MSSDFLDIVMPIFTKLGSGGLIWVTVSLLFLDSRRYRTDGFELILSLLLCVLLGNLILKPLIGRSRPCDKNLEVPLLIARPTDYSFPSGHTLSSFASAIVIFHVNDTWGFAAVILAFFIAFSRLYLFVHYPSDILAGILIGMSIGTAAIWVYRVYQLPGILK
jgi:undecaprenyl-diphosphatase